MVFIILGMIFGSFASVLVTRNPSKESIVFPPSHCDHCMYRLSWYDNIPVFSFIYLKGKCRNCQRSISPIYPILEIGSAIFFYMIGSKDGFILIDASFLLFFVMAINDFYDGEFSTTHLVAFAFFQISYILLYHLSFSPIPFLFFLLLVFNQFTGEKYIGNGDLWILLILSFHPVLWFISYFILLGLIGALLLPYFIFKNIRKIHYLPILFSAFICNTLFYEKFLYFLFNY